MAKRKDGIERKAVLLEAATKVFAEKGFRDTTVSDICTAARSNVASVNYYFGSKDDLYAEVWKHAFRTALEKYPLDMHLAPDSSPQERLKAFIRSLLHKMLDAGELGFAGQILMVELASPTDALDLVKKDAIEPMRSRMKGILRELLGKNVSERNITFCALSIIHQCLGFGFKKGRLPAPLRHMNKTELLESLAEHITCFSLAGIRAVKS
jgi:AcrR family transcriptional regulator